MKKKPKKVTLVSAIEKSQSFFFPNRRASTIQSGVSANCGTMYVISRGTIRDCIGITYSTR